MTPVVAGVSIGTVALVGGVIVVAGIVYLAFKNNENKKKNTKEVKKIISDENRYKGYINIVKKAIEEKDLDTLKEMLQTKSVRDFPDLIKIIEEALKQK